ncbi:glucose-6-phosphate dehydrogenase [Sporomusa sp.]|uniref:glucose-6-phosphate dehydrogenase n=1 Tax=Sporomusa sp. TaxID=2078658 RepID=UPI002B9C92F0|nr:glucose-6-phosphate dehydrogenase [Sporomusa sp.]HWR07255.1 glucose-6-phosphate dehydrogenase [Sporomusa sp.]
MEPGFTNPLNEGLGLRRAAEPCTIVIFGASGDLTKRKLIPALYSLAGKNLLAAGFSVVGAARTPMSHAEFRETMFDAVNRFSDTGPVQDIMWQNFANSLFYNTTDTKSPDSYQQLGLLLDEIDHTRGTQGNRIFFIATPPNMFISVIQRLHELGLDKSPTGGWTRIVIEKPFGLDLTSAKQLNQEVLRVFGEDQVFRIDHYLGKETVQNIMVFRFANGIFEPLWNRHFIDHVQITAAESIGVESRGEYYEQSGAFRDMIQNHMMQLLALVAMEPPVSLDTDAVRNEKIKVLQAIRPFSPAEVNRYAVRGQYGSGEPTRPQLKAYRQEANIDPGSTTETYAALKLFIDNWRWAGIPFYLRSGKRLDKQVSEIAIQFKKAPHRLFKENAGGTVEANTLVLQIQPDEGISLRFNAKIPGQALTIRPVNMDFRYAESFSQKSPEAYARLLLDAMLGDSSLYARGDMVEKTWELLTPVLEAWQQFTPEIPQYAPGSWGPPEADQLLERDQRRWRQP